MSASGRQNRSRSDFQRPLPLIERVGPIAGESWSAEAVGALHALAGSSAFDECLEVNTRQQFRGGEEIQVPTTVAWGERDRLLIPRQARRAARAIPGARHVTLRGCGHVPTWDAPDQVARVVLEASAP